MAIKIVVNKQLHAIMKNMHALYRQINNMINYIIQL